MSTSHLHKTQVSILHALRYAKSERFSALMHATDHTSDTFKFHVRKLVKMGYATKLENGQYELTPRGKEYANSLNERSRTTEKQPKLSILTVVAKATPHGEPTYLLQQRSRNPFYGYWSEIHGRATWGESFEETAKHQLKRQAGLDATFTVHSFRRIRDYDASNKGLLEDKLFVILKATSVAGKLSNDYSGGLNAWLTLAELRAKGKVFATTIAILEELESGSFYCAQDLSYTQEDY